MKINKTLILIFLFTKLSFIQAQVNQILTEISPLSILSKNGKESIYLKVSKSSDYILTLDKSSNSDFVFKIYDISNKKYITDKVKRRDFKIRLDKNFLYAIIYVGTKNENIKFSLTDLDFSILSSDSLKAKTSKIEKEDFFFTLKDLPVLNLTTKLKKYILRIYKGNIYIAYQLENSDDIKVAEFIQDVGWFNLDSSVNGNITNIVNFDFSINSKGNLYIAFVTKSGSDFASELIVKKFNSRKWIDISPSHVENFGSLLNISIDLKDRLYLAYLREIGGEYKVNLISNMGYGSIWTDVIHAYLSKGDSNVNSSNIGLISEPFLGIFYNYKSNNDIKSEFIVNNENAWVNANIPSVYMANFIKGFFDSNFNQIIMSFVSENRPIINICPLKSNKWINISPNVEMEGSSTDIGLYKNNLFLAFEDNNNVRLIYFKNKNWYFLNKLENFKSDVKSPQIGIYSNQGLVVSTLSSNSNELFFTLVCQ
ncbi:hypothetical protein [Borreliella lanei]|uniref:Uncharacterized protein n=1 Tax=Borreliella lanei TaxID=373540 RepID=A0A7X0DK37_9SPIR|nr:hypothetical protein [Borreliella lanei]MBB6207634.1 hypothetical protein [Borreliella lanei]WKC86532.1 hypothetical protein QIA23_04170 [Borreliella lanei]